MKKILFILVIATIFGCNNDESNDQTDMLDINLISGINIKETIEQDLLELGNPNIFVSNKFAVYPNPATNVVKVFSQETITDIYFVPANAEKIHQDVNFNGILNSSLYPENSISSLSTLKLNNQNQASVDVDISDLESGYYRVFIKTEGQLFWDNFYKLNNLIDGDSQIDEIFDFWN